MTTTFERKRVPYHMSGQFLASAVSDPIPAPTPEPVGARAASSDQGTVLFAGHSFVQTPWGGQTSDGHHGGILYSDWPGNTLSDFASFGSARQIWDLNGNARNAAYDQVIVSEIADLATGFPEIGTPASVATLQTLYWFGLAAQQRRAELILLTPWSPMMADLDATADPAFAYYRQWLEHHLGQPVWIIPAGAYVRAMRAEFGDVIFSDGLHLDPASRYPRGLSYLVYSFLTKQRCPFMRPEDEDIDQMAWDVLQAQSWAGFGGSLEVLPPEVPDPLPNPDSVPQEAQ